MRQRDVLGDEDFDYLFADDSWWDDPASPVNASQRQVHDQRRAARDQSAPSVGTAWAITPRPGPPWYRSKAVLLAAAGAIVIAIVVMILRAFDGEDETPPNVPPQPEVPSSDISTQVSAPPTPSLPPPPPPAPSASQVPTPGVTAPYYPGPRTGEPFPTDGPEIGVTRTPVTRKPISVSPPPPPPPQYNQGDGRKLPF